MAFVLAFANNDEAITLDEFWARNNVPWLIIKTRQSGSQPTLNAKCKSGI
jgi:hypothetical protein